MQTYSWQLLVHQTTIIQNASHKIGFRENLLIRILSYFPSPYILALIFFFLIVGSLIIFGTIVSCIYLIRGIHYLRISLVVKRIFNCFKKKFNHFILNSFFYRINRYFGL